MVRRVSKLENVEDSVWTFFKDVRPELKDDVEGERFKMFDRRLSWERRGMGGLVCTCSLVGGVAGCCEICCCS